MIVNDEQKLESLDREYQNAIETNSEDVLLIWDEWVALHESTKHG